jgi:hypothetical protein
VKKNVRVSLTARLGSNPPQAHVGLLGHFRPAAYRRRAGSRSAWCRASASADTLAYLASHRTEV